MSIKTNIDVFAAFVNHLDTYLICEENEIVSKLIESINLVKEPGATALEIRSRTRSFAEVAQKVLQKLKSCKIELDECKEQLSVCNKEVSKLREIYLKLYGFKDLFALYEHTMHGQDERKKAGDMKAAPENPFKKLLKNHSRLVPKESLQNPVEVSNPDTPVSMSPNLRGSLSPSPMSLSRSSVSHPSSSGKAKAAAISTNTNTTVPSPPTVKRPSNTAFSKFNMKYLKDLAPSGSLTTQLPQQKWTLLNKESMYDELARIFKSTKDQIKRVVEDEAIRVLRIRCILEEFRREIGVQSVDAVHIVQPLFYAYLKHLCETIGCDPETVCWNDDTLIANFLCEDGKECTFTGKGEIVFLERVLVEIKAGCMKLARSNVDQLFITMYATLNKKIDEKSLEKSGSTAVSATTTAKESTASHLVTDEASPGHSPITTRSLNDFFKRDKSATDSSVVGLISNFSSLVLGYGDSRGGKYEFGFTNIHEGALPPEEFVLRLLYILTLSPEKAFDHAAQTRSTDMGATTAGADNVVAGPRDAERLHNNSKTDKDRQGCPPDQFIQRGDDYSSITLQHSIYGMDHQILEKMLSRRITVVGEYELTDEDEDDDNGSIVSEDREYQDFIQDDFDDGSQDECGRGEIDYADD